MAAVLVGTPKLEALYRVCGERGPSADNGRGRRARPRSGLRRRHRSRAGSASERRRDHDRRPDGRRPERHAGDPAGVRAPRRHLLQLVGLVSGLLPVAGELPDRSLRPQPRGHGALLADRRLRALQRRRRAAGMARARGVCHGPHRQVPQRLRHRPPGDRAARMERVVRRGRPRDLPDVGLHAQRERPPGHLREPDRREPRQLPDRRLPREGARRHPPWQPVGPPVLPVACAAGPASRGGGDPTRDRGDRPLRSAPPRALRVAPFAAPARLQRARPVRQADVHAPLQAARRRGDRPHHGRVPRAARVAARGRRGGRGDRPRAARPGDARQHLPAVHLRQRLPARRARCSRTSRRAESPS